MSGTPLSFNLVEHLLPGQRTLIDEYMAHDLAISNAAVSYGSETLTGATGLIIADLTKRTSNLSVTGAVAFTLPDGTYAGQEHEFVCTVAASIPVGTLTVTTPETAAGFVCGAVFVFNVVGQSIKFKWSGTKWRCIAKARRGTLAGIVGGTTVLTGHSMVNNYVMAVDGTDAGTGEGGLPNGSVPGERVTITCSQADNIPAGSLTGLYTNLLGTAATICGAIGVVASASVVGDIAVLEWNGASWQAIYQAGVTFS